MGVERHDTRKAFVPMILRYAIAWVGLAVLAVGNGIARQYGYGPQMSELAAHQLSTVTAMVLTGAFVLVLQRRWPIESPGQAWAIGGLWLLMTVLFEFGFGHYVAGHDWDRLLADYALHEGRVWALFLLWILVLPRLTCRRS